MRVLPNRSHFKVFTLMMESVTAYRDSEAIREAASLDRWRTSTKWLRAMSDSRESV